MHKAVVSQNYHRTIEPLVYMLHSPWPVLEISILMLKYPCSPQNGPQVFLTRQKPVLELGLKL